jgi:[acyl-carrier-protein] S-malonyltransferase
MGAAWVAHESFELVSHASEIVGFDVAQLLLEADQATLTRTANAQLATFVMSLVVLDAAERLGLEPATCAGHSLGEYSALVAAGALSYEDGLRLVCERGAAMQDAADQRAGTMMAVLGLDDDDVAAACQRSEQDAWVANYNAPGQVVIAGDPDALQEAGAIAKSLGAKRLVSFPVGGAFHTPYMAPARDRLRKALQAVTFRVAEPPVVSNVDARAHLDPADWPALLSAQLCGPVRWRQSLATMHAEGARTFIELGPGGVLTGLVKRALPFEGVSAVSVATPEDLETLVERLAGKEPAQLAHLGGPYAMTERLIVSPATGRFRPEPAFEAAGPKLTGRTAAAERADASDRPVVAVGERIGWAGETEIRSAFAGSLEGLLVLPGERVVPGQPVAWLRVNEER